MRIFRNCEHKLKFDDISGLLVRSGMFTAFQEECLRSVAVIYSSGLGQVIHTTCGLCTILVRRPTLKIGDLINHEFVPCLKKMMFILIATSDESSPRSCRTSDLEESMQNMSI